MQPDSALVLLSLSEAERPEVPEEVRMYRCLLIVRANDRLHISSTSDSLLLPVVRFYEKYGNRERLTQAYYCLGNIYRDMNDVPRALKTFYQAVEIGEQTKLDGTVGNAYEQMGTLLVASTYMMKHKECFGSPRIITSFAGLCTGFTEYSPCP